MNRVIAISKCLSPLILLLFLTANAGAYSRADALATIDWTSLTIDYSGSLSILWDQQAAGLDWGRSDSEAYVDDGAAGKVATTGVGAGAVTQTTTTAGTVTAEDILWGAPGDTAASVSGLYNLGQALTTDDQLFAQAYASGQHAAFSISDYRESEAYSYSDRRGTIITTSEGDLTISVNYELTVDVAATTDPADDLASAQAWAFLELFGTAGGSASAYLSRAVDYDNPFDSGILSGTFLLSTFLNAGETKQFQVGVTAWSQTVGTPYYPVTSDPVPEPGTFLLFGTGLMGLFFFRKNRKGRRHGEK